MGGHGCRLGRRSGQSGPCPLIKPTGDSDRGSRSSVHTTGEAGSDPG
jgi:hypothetical protein